MRLCYFLFRSVLFKLSKLRGQQMCSALFYFCLRSQIPLTPADFLWLILLKRSMEHVSTVLLPALNRHHLFFNRMSTPENSYLPWDYLTFSCRTGPNKRLVIIAVHLEEQCFWSTVHMTLKAPYKNSLCSHNKIVNWGIYKRPPKKNASDVYIGTYCQSNLSFFLKHLISFNLHKLAKTQNVFWRKIL